MGGGWGYGYADAGGAGGLEVYDEGAGRWEVRV